MSSRTSGDRPTKKGRSREIYTDKIEEEEQSSGNDRRSKNCLPC